MARRPDTFARAGFSMVELVVVVVILGVLAAAMVPRLLAFGGREARASAEAAADLLSVAARRDSLTSQRVAVEFSESDAEVSLLVMPPTDPDAREAPDWRPDPLVQSVRLGSVQLLQALADGVELDARSWRVEFPQGARRPALELVFGTGQKDRWTVALVPGAAHASIRSGLPLGPGLTDGSIDLDATGGATTPW